MQKVKPIVFVFLLIVGCVTVVWGMSALSNPAEKKIMMAAVPAPAAPESKTMLYDNLRLDTLSLSRQAFEYALEGYRSLKAAGELANDRVLFIIDIISGRLLFNTFVSHGRNSGAAMATRFSNRPESNQSSLGFYVTGDTYRGEHGYSLKLEGMEKGINDNAFMRKIVVHGANYVNEKIISQKGYIGRSLGCPAIPDRLKTAIINVIRDGSCLFLYSPDRHYLSHSPVLAQFINPFAKDSLIAG
jgi:hypothetical protein